MSNRPPKNGRRPSDGQRNLTEAEWLVMRVVWAEEPCAAGTVQEALVDTRNWTYGTVKTTMDRMVKKGLLGTHRIRNLNLYTSHITEQEAQTGEFRRMLTRAFDGAFAPMMQFLVENKELSEEELAQFRENIGKTEPELEGK